MKTQIFVLLIFISSIQSVAVNSHGKSVKKDRRLTFGAATESKILDDNNQISIPKIKAEASELHRVIKFCIDMEFSKEPEDMLDFQTIMELCAGYNYSIILRFFKEINYEVKETVKEKIKANMRSGFCDNSLYMCMDYFSMLDLFMDKDLSVMETMQANLPELERRIDKGKLEYMMRLSEQEIADYNIIKNDIADEKRFFDDYFGDKKTEYEEKMDKRHADNQSEAVSQAINGDYNEIVDQEEPDGEGGHEEQYDENQHPDEDTEEDEDYVDGQGHDASEYSHRHAVRP